MFLCFVGSCQRFFLLARSGRKTDGHIINIRMFIKFFMFFFAYRQGLKKFQCHSITQYISNKIK